MNPSLNLTLNIVHLRRNRNLPDSQTECSVARTQTSFWKMKALQMSVVHVLAFLLLWTPYTIMATL